jgi:hypothetical protein
MAKHEGEMSRSDMKDIMQRHISEENSNLNKVFK